MKFRAPVVTAFSLLGNSEIKLFNRTKIRYFSPLREREREREGERERERERERESAGRRKAARMGGESRRFSRQEGDDRCRREKGPALP